jgi:hypothetical protein
MPESVIFCRPPLVNRWLVITPVLHYVVSRTSFRLPWRSPCLSKICRHVSVAGGSFMPPFHRGHYPENGLAAHSSSTPIVFCLFDRVGVNGSPIISWRSSCGACRLGAWPSGRWPACQPRSLSSLNLEAVGFLWPGLLPRLKTLYLPSSLFMWSLGRRSWPAVRRL